ILASLLNALILFAAVVFIILECIEKFRHPQAVGGMAIMITAGVGILINGGTVLLFQRDKEHDVNIKGAYLHMLADTLVSAGVVVSGAVIYFTNWTIIDPIVGLVIAGVIIISSYPLLTESLRLALDGIPSAVRAPELLAHLRNNANVSDIHHCHIWAISTTENALTAHVVLKDFTALERTQAELHAESSEHGVTHATFEFERHPCNSSNC
ncbi:MAG: cation diffusion facilitator family transporter, partial [Victivallaceae bacterium]